MVKVVTLFLIVVLALAMFGKLGWIGRLGPSRRPPRVARPATCLHCGRHVIGTGPCDCRSAKE